MIVMKKMDYKQGNSDHTLFVKHIGYKVCTLVYVDDIVIRGDDEEEIIRLKKEFLEEFELKDLGKLRYFLGVEFAGSK